ncbi:MAG: hypothetical protein GQ564_12935 [Bacteroidales bacterium]|nr:hypothetical protein [Bacteroidales bacterium]
MKNYIIIVFVLILNCCANNQIKESATFYDNGNIKEKFIYEFLKDTTTYSYYSYYLNGNIKEKYSKHSGKYSGSKIEYYQNGVIKSIVPFIKGKADGTVKLYYENGSLDLIKTYKDDNLFGLYMTINPKNPRIIQKILFVNDEPLIKIDEGNTKVDNEEIVGMTYYYYCSKDSIYYPIGTLSYDGNKQRRRQIYCSYFETFAADTVNYDESYKMKIVSHIGIMEGHNIELYLGEINEDFEFVDSANVKVFRSEDNTLEINLSQSDYLLGNNLLTGKIRVFKNGKDITNQYMIDPIADIPYIFFKQFFVKPR